ncbi:pituitary tumor-transforming gene 1 protein-interacting protein-like isoform X1 [Asterias rubens]|uniref:pituitary tumor-transforming gene 1 protein-interacting protein-like isoform X1 n=1 Tax=Asterias rubens TaxID=7604 RepID=UPI001455D257|nr:pituitary tumor-transforming gene 1 protein-interacting protein-like isoform X1 [Asterias rubens]
MKGGVFLATLLVFFVCICLENCLVSAATTTEKPLTTPPIEDTCGAHNGSCDECVKFPGAKCFYCYTNGVCAKYPGKEIFPTKYCDLSQARWGVCFLNFEALIISMGVIAGVLLLAMTICIYCCCCCSGSNRAKYAKEDAKVERKKTERKMHHEQKKADRKAKNDEIRRKYGLMPDDEGSYHKLDESATA